MAAHVGVGKADGHGDHLGKDRLGEGVDEQDDVRAALGVMDVDTRHACPGSSTPVDPALQGADVLLADVRELDAVTSETGDAISSRGADALRTYECLEGQGSGPRLDRHHLGDLAGSDEHRGRVGNPNDHATESETPRSSRTHRTGEHLLSTWPQQHSPGGGSLTGYRGRQHKAKVADRSRRGSDRETHLDRFRRSADTGGDRDVDLGSRRAGTSEAEDDGKCQRSGKGYKRAVPGHRRAEQRQSRQDALGYHLCTYSPSERRGRGAHCQLGRAVGSAPAARPGCRAGLRGHSASSAPGPCSSAPGPCSSAPGPCSLAPGPCSAVS